jgi:hypothetical protein
MQNPQQPMDQCQATEVLGEIANVPEMDENVHPKNPGTESQQSLPARG